MLALYHSESAVCAAKVRMTLAEKALPWEGRRVNLERGEQFSPEYLKLNPNGVVPTLVHDDAVVIESTVINEYLDEAFPDRPLRPASDAGRARMRLWTKREDGIHDAINTMSNVLVFRPDMLTKTAAEQSARIDAIPDPARRAKWRELLAQGAESGIVQTALVRFARHFRDMEAALANGPFLLGEQFTLADSGLLSFFYRLEVMHVAGMWAENFPAVMAWFARCRARPSFTTAIIAPIPAPVATKYDTLSANSWADVAPRYATALRA